METSGEVTIARPTVKADLALRAVAEAEDIEVSDEDIEAELGRMAERLGQKPAQLLRQLERAEQMPAVRSDVRKSKALEWLVDHVEVVDEEGHLIDRSQECSFIGFGGFNEPADLAYKL